MQLDLGSRVRTTDGGNAGKIKRIIFDSDRMRVREFVIHEGILFRNERIVDLDLIEKIDDDHTVTLKIAEDTVDDLPVYIHETHTPVFAGDLHHAQEVGILVQPGSVPGDAVVLSHGSEVYDVDDHHVGHLDEIVYGEGGAARAFRVESGFLFEKEVEIPISEIASVTHRRIRLKVRAAELAPAATN